MRQVSIKLFFFIFFHLNLWAENLHLGDIAPDFSVETTLGKINFHQWLKGRWGIIFSHPKAFTPVCTTELGVLALLQKEFDERDTQIIALSIDNKENQKKWIADINSKQNSQIKFPLISDENAKVARLYGMIREKDDKDLNVRSVFIVGPDTKIKLILTYPASTGRNFSEILRVLDSLQLSTKKNVSTPANWQPGNQVILPKNLSDQEIKKKYPGLVKKIYPYLRYIDQSRI